MKRDELVAWLDETLAPGEVRDYGPNGLQVEGREEIRKVVTGVTACLELLERAASVGADAVLVHHGIFWKGAGEVRVERSLRRRLALLLREEINLLAYHLPLDRHPVVGNNAVLARELGVTDLVPAFPLDGVPIGLAGRFPAPLPVEDVVRRVAEVTGREPLHVPGGPDPVRTVGLVSGDAPGSIAEAARMGLDLFLTGEPSEPAVHLAREEGIHLVAAGHHATERFGVRALGELIAREHGLEVVFLDVPNPV